MNAQQLDAYGGPERGTFWCRDSRRLAALLSACEAVLTAKGTTQ